MQTFTLEEAEAFLVNKYGWHESGRKILQEQLLEAVKDGKFPARHPVSVSDLNRFFEEAGVPGRLDNDGETVVDSPFETEWWNLIQVLAWVYLGDRALVGEGAVVREEGAAVTPMLLIIAAISKHGACYPSFDLAQDAVIEALQTRGLTAYGLENDAGGLKEIPPLQWADLKFWWDPEHAGPRDRSRLRASRWYALRFKRKAILALWPDPLESLTMADAHNRTPSDMRTGAAIATRKDNKNDRRKKLKLFIDDVYTALDKDGYALVDNGRRKPLPVSKASLRTAFIDRHPEHKISLATFNDDLPQISVKVNPGRKRLTVKYLKQF